MIFAEIFCYISILYIYIVLSKVSLRRTMTNIGDLNKGNYRTAVNLLMTWSYDFNSRRMRTTYILCGLGNQRCFHYLGFSLSQMDGQFGDKGEGIL